MSEAIALPKTPPSPRSLRMLGDRRIARLAARGDERAFTAIYERYHQALYRYCRSIVGNEHDALDALQNTMASVLRALPGEERDIALKPWLYRIAHNESIALLRGRHTHQELSDAEQIQMPGVEQQTFDRDRLRQLVSDLRELPERQRGALVMRELNGLSYKEIAATFGTTPAVAKQTVYEARTGLQEQAEGREMSCEAVQRSISANDGRVLRGRRVRAHLRSCSDCSGFREAIETRPGELGAIAPPLSAVAAASVLRGLLGGGAHAGGGGGGIFAAAAGGSAKAIAGSAALKVAVVAAITVGVGAGMHATGVTPFVGGSTSKSPGADTPASAGASSPVTEGASSPVKASAVRTSQSGQANTMSKDTGRHTGAPTGAGSEHQASVPQHSASPLGVAANHPTAPSSHPAAPAVAPSHTAPTSLPAVPAPPVPGVPSRASRP